jgi:hypothetical protein
MTFISLYIVNERFKHLIFSFTDENQISLFYSEIKK